MGDAVKQFKNKSEKFKMIKKIYHNKLVRDKMPNIIKSREGLYKTRVLKIGEFRKILREKIVEEVKELVDAREDELVGEMADLLQILISIAKLEKIPFNTVEKVRKKKEKERGAFKKRIFLIWSDKKAGGK